MIFVGLLLLGFVSLIDGSHFLGGTITWQPQNASATGTSIAIVITQTYLWTYYYIACTNSMIAGNQFVPSYSGLSTDTLDCIVNCGAGAVGYSYLNVIPRCTDFSTTIGISIGQRSDIVYLQTGDDFTVAYQNGDWCPLTTNSAAEWSVASRINLTPRSDNGLYNSAPVATVMSPINIPVNQPTIINIPIGDADGDTLRCRWANKTNGVDECADVCPPSSLPPSTIIYPNCTIIITGQYVGDWFAVALMVEDFINSSSTTPLSATPVQFLVDVVASPTCTEPPQIVGEPVADSCSLLLVGQTFSFKLIAINNCGSSVTIDDIATLSFSGMLTSNLVMMNSTTYYKSLTWTPTAAQTGYQIMCAMAFDSQESQSAQYCFKFYVSTENLCFCPGSSCSTTTTSTTSTATSTTTSTETSTTTSTTTATTSTKSTTSTSTVTENATTISITTASPKNSVSTISSSSANNFNLIQWILIGIIAGIPLLLTLILCSCLCWYYCCPCGLGGLELSDRQGSFEFYHIESIDHSPNATPSDECSSSFTDLSVFSNDNNSKKNLWFDDEYTTQSVGNKSPLRYQSNNSPVKKRPVRKKPNRVTVFSLPPKTSASTLIDSTMIFNLSRQSQRPYYQQEHQ